MITTFHDERQSLTLRFQALLEQHVQALRLRGAKATGLCPFHDEKHPSFSADLSKGVWHCFACGKAGGVRRFADLFAETWIPERLTWQERQRVTVLRRRREAENAARAILAHREEDRLTPLFAEWRALNHEASQALHLLKIFHRWPGLATEFPTVAAAAARAYGAVTNRRLMVEAEISGEVAS